jgi:DNA polymerase
MDRDEAVLRELNLYPLWKRRDVIAADDAQAPVTVSVAESVAVPPTPIVKQQPVAIDGAPDHLISVSKNTKKDADNYSDVSGELSHLGWSELKQQVRGCTACKLRSSCTQTVFGVGDENADWLFVGEGPGADEDVQGEPFVGKEGQLLDNMLRAIKLKRGNNVYIANIVKCCPPNNRNPDAVEISTCLPYLQRQIELIQPKLIIALGKTAATALLGKDATLKSLRGQRHDYRGTPLLITYHPAYLLRSPSEKAKAWQDLCLAAEVYETEIG